MSHTLNDYILNLKKISYMLRYLLVLLLLPSFVSAQKVIRATKLLQEGKYEKSAELYREILDKDTADVASSFGYVISVIRQTENPGFVVTDSDLVRYFKMIKTGEKNFNNLTPSDKSFISSNILQSVQISDYLKWISETLWQLYISKTTSPFVLENYQQNYYHENSFISTPDLSKRVETLYFDSLAVVDNKDGWLMFVKKFPRSSYYKEARKSIAKIDFNAAMKSEGSTPIKAFIANYPNEIFTSQAKVELEKREYVELEANPTEYNLELYLKEYPLTQHKGTIQEKLAKIYFEGIESSNDLNSIEQAVQKMDAFKSSQIIKNIIDSSKLIAFKIEYDIIKDVNEFTSLSNFIKKYDYLSNPEIDAVRKKYYVLWNQKLNEEGLQATVSDLKRFIKEFEKYNDGTFLAIGDKVVSDFSEYISSKKDDLVEYILRNRMFASASKDQVKEAVRIIAPQVKFDLQLTGQIVIDRIKNYRGDAKTIADLSGVFMKNMISNELILGTEGSDEGIIFSINRVDVNQKINASTYVWNGVTYSAADIGTKDPIYGIIASRYGISNFSKPFFTGSVENDREFIVRLFGYRKTDQTNYPGFQIDMYYKIQNNRLIPDRARSISNYYSATSFISDENKMYNFSSELQLVLNDEETEEED